MMTTDTARESCTLKVRRGIATPLYAIALILSYLSDAIANAAAAIREIRSVRDALAAIAADLN